MVFEWRKSLACFKNFEAHRTWLEKWGRHGLFSSLLLKQLF